MADDADRVSLERTVQLFVDRGEASVVDQEHRENVVRVRRVVSVGTVLWVLTIALDWSTTTFVEPAGIGYFALVRAGALLNLLFVVARLSRPALPSPRGFAALQAQTYLGTAAAVALLAARNCGIESPYTASVSCILAVQGISLPDQARRGAVRMGGTVTVYVGTLVLTATWEPAVRAQLHSARSVALFGQHVTLALVTGALLVAGGHATHVLRRRVFEARALGRYRLKKKLGQGGMGEVWLAYHPALKTDVAIKVVRGVGAPASAAARFEREISALTGLRHPNTVRVFDCGVTDDGVLYYVMELLEGSTLAELVARAGPLSPGRAVHVVRQAARALAEAHQKGIVHRDLKPGNLFVTSARGRARLPWKVLDFGIVKLRDDDEASTLTAVGVVVGTPAYISPEQARGDEVDARADVYSLGAVLHFALTGYPPFAASSPMTMMVAHLTAVPEAPSESAPSSIPRALDAVVLRCLAKRPEDRFAGMLDLDAALEACDVPPQHLGDLAFEATTNESA